VMLSIGNAHRTGVLSNFTLDDYSKASKPDRDGNITYSICLHKTVSSHGAATIAANADDVKLLAGYVKFRKHQCFDALHGVRSSLSLWWQAALAQGGKREIRGDP